MSSNPPSNDQDNPSDSPQSTTANSPIDSQISPQTSLTYWSSVPPTTNGMLGGYEEVTSPDLKQSKRFISQVRRILQTSSSNSQSQPQLPLPTKINRAVDCGAGIGRITKGLLLKIAETVDIVEPIPKFAAEVEKLKVKLQDVNGNSNSNDGQIGDIYIQGLESWSPNPPTKYSIIWNQWCLGHLTDTQLTNYLQRAATALTGPNGSSNNSSQEEEKGWIMIKENLSKESDGDIFDSQDSSVTRTDGNFRRIFKEAGLTVVKAGRQEGFPSELYTVMMYALRPS